jgi:hypothetical protein
LCSNNMLSSLKWRSYWLVVCIRYLGNPASETIKHQTDQHMSIFLMHSMESHPSCNFWAHRFTGF